MLVLLAGCGGRASTGQSPAAPPARGSLPPVVATRPPPSLPPEWRSPVVFHPKTREALYVTRSASGHGEGALLLRRVNPDTGRETTNPVPEVPGYAAALALDGDTLFVIMQQTRPLQLPPELHRPMAQKVSLAAVRCTLAAGTCSASPLPVGFVVEFASVDAAGRLVLAGLSPLGPSDCCTPALAAVCTGASCDVLDSWAEGWMGEGRAAAFDKTRRRLIYSKMDYMTGEVALFVGALDAYQRAQSTPRKDAHFEPFRFAPKLFTTGFDPPAAFDPRRKEFVLVATMRTTDPNPSEFPSLVTCNVDSLVCTLSRLPLPPFVTDHPWAVAASQRHLAFIAPTEEEGPLRLTVCDRAKLGSCSRHPISYQAGVPPQVSSLRANGPAHALISPFEGDTFGVWVEGFIGVCGRSTQSCALRKMPD